jgi:acyl-CoA synthetase (AMP-forming)/AMP-acid ligase II
MNVGAFLTKAARVHPTRVAVTDGSRVLRYAELDAQAAAFADGLRRRGYAPGDRVVIFMANRLEYFTVLFGLFKGGLVAVPVNAKLHASELHFILEHARPRAVVYSAKTSDTVEAGLLATAGVERIDVDRQGPSSLAAIAADGHAAGFADIEVDADDAAWMFYTSGTTGRPKGAMLSHRNLCTSAINALADICDFQPEDVVLHVAPLSHGSGLYALPSIARAAKNIIYVGGSFDAEDVLATAARERVTIMAFLAPTMIHMLLEAGREHTIPSLRRVVYGGGPIDPGLAAAAIERFGPVFVQLYGMGESPMTITYLRPQDHRGKALSSAGIVRTDVEVRLVDESGAAVAEGSEGEVCVRGDVVMLGYWNDSQANARALSAGWLHTGDIGRFEDGYLYLVARKSDVIISGGSNIYPREVEDVLLLHPAVKDACVFGVPDPKWGESVVAAVVALAPIDSGELLEHCRAHIASFKKPKRIEFVDALPTNANGKVLRRELRERLITSDAPA